MVTYIVQVSMAMAVFYAVYRLVFARFTFFRLNRVYILSALLLSFMMPFFELHERSVMSSEIPMAISIDWSELDAMTDFESSSESSSFFAVFVQFIFIIYILVAGWKVCKSVIGMLRVGKRYSEAYVEVQQGLKIVVHPKVVSPFTLFRTIYLDQETYRQGNTPVLRHEMVHARENHSIDLLVSEIICALLWFNPFVFLFKRQMRENHEYLADDASESRMEELLMYMKAMTFGNDELKDPVLASFYRSSTLKKRVIMLTNNRTKKLYRVLYVAVVPMAAFLIMSFQQPAEALVSDAQLSLVQQFQVAELPGDPETGIPSRFPLDEKFRKKISWEFGKEAMHPIKKKIQVHKGVDIPAPKGTPVYATAKGLVVKAMSHESYGKLVVIKHADGIVSLYAHLDDFDVEVDRKVAKGAQIGTVGNTGYSTGPHLHYEVRKDGEHVDPAEYFN